MRSITRAVPAERRRTGICGLREFREGPDRVLDQLGLPRPVGASGAPLRGAELRLVRGRTQVCGMGGESGAQRPLRRAPFVLAPLRQESGMAAAHVGAQAKKAWQLLEKARANYALPMERVLGLPD